MKMNLRTRYDTADAPPNDRFSYWRESVCNSYVRLGCEVENTRNFKGAIEISRHSAMHISKVGGLAHRVERRKRDIGSDTDEFFLVSLQTNATSCVSQSGRTAALRTGDMALYSSSEPYALQLADNFGQTVVQFPATALKSRLPNAERMTARAIRGHDGIGKLVRESILAFSDYMSASPPAVQVLIQETLVDLIATGLATEGINKLDLLSPEKQVLLRTKAFIRNHLGDSNLNRNVVSVKMAMSVRRLNEIFAKEGESISGFIRSERLSAIASDLKDERFEAITISEIAYRYGFSNMQSFSTLFRSTFDQSPRAFRAK